MDISLPGDNAHPIGMTGRDGIIYVGDGRDDKVYAYDTRTGSRRSGQDVNGIDTLRKDMTDLWMNGETIWISYWLGDFIRAYDVDTGARQPHLDIQLARENAAPVGIDSDRFQPLDHGPDQRHHLRVRPPAIGGAGDNAGTEQGRGPTPGPANHRPVRHLQ